MEAKIVVGTKSGKSYNLEVKDDLAAVFIGKRISDVVNVTPLGLKGYEVRITGGSDKSGFPMRKDLHQLGRGKAMMSTRTAGYVPIANGVRARKTVVGDMINDAISQINTVVVKEGKDPIEKLLGLEKSAETAPEAPKAGAPKEHKAEVPKEAPKEHKAEPHKEVPKDEKKEPPKEHKVEVPKEAPKAEKHEKK